MLIDTERARETERKKTTASNQRTNIVVHISSHQVCVHAFMYRRIHSQQKRRVVNEQMNACTKETDLSMQCNVIYLHLHAILTITSPFTSLRIAICNEHHRKSKAPMEGESDRGYKKSVGFKCAHNEINELTQKIPITIQSKNHLLLVFHQSI